MKEVPVDSNSVERQITFAGHGHLLTNVNVWSPDGRWIYYDVRSDPAGSRFDGGRIERVSTSNGEVQVLWVAPAESNVGVVTVNPVDGKIVFIHGPDNPGTEGSYSAWNRRGVLLDPFKPGEISNLDARDLVPPFTPGALRGGSHVHVFSPDGQWVSFTYEDRVLADLDENAMEAHRNRRGVGICVPRPVAVPKSHPGNRDGAYFSVLVSQLTDNPAPGSDQIRSAIEDAWVGVEGYVRANGTRQRRAIAFQGEVVSVDAKSFREVFVVDLSDDPTRPGDGPLEGTPARRPAPPAGVVQRRLTRTQDRRFPGICGPRHWLRSSPDGSQIACLMKDEAGIVQIFTVATATGRMVQLTRNAWDIASAFTWSDDGRLIAAVMDNSVFAIDTATGISTRLTPRCEDANAPKPQACVFSPDGGSIAFVRTVGRERRFNQIFTVTRAH